MKAAPSFSVVIVTHDSAAELRVLLDSIDRHLDPSPELIVVDAGSADDSAQVAGTRARTIELGHNPGFGAASNAGVAAAGAPVTVLLNPDVVLLDDSLATLVRAASSADSLLVPRLLNPDRSIQRSAHPLPGTARALLPALVHPRLLPRGPRLAADPWRSEVRRRVGWAIAACVAAQTRILLELGPFDPEQFLFYEDMDLCLGARARGYPTELDPGVALVHTGGHATSRRYGGEPYDLLAQRRRQVVGRRLGRRALALDDAAQGITFATRALARAALRRDGSRERAQLAALRSARQIRDGIVPAA